MFQAAAEWEAQGETPKPSRVQGTQNTQGGQRLGKKESVEGEVSVMNLAFWVVGWSGERFRVLWALLSFPSSVPGLTD